MSDRPTFSLVSDWATLADLDHITFRIYAIICTNAEFGRNGLTTHNLHVTASWVVDATSHWEKPLGTSTVRKHMQKLVKAGVLVRVNNPNEGMGTIYSIVTDPGEEYEGPVNGFSHARQISRRKDTKSVYRRIPLDGAIPGPKEKPKTIEEEDVTAATPFDDVATPEAAEQFFENADIQANLFDDSEIPPQELEFGFEEPKEKNPGLTPQAAEFAAELEAITGRHSEEKLHLMTGVCRRIAIAVTPALERGWDPRNLAKRLSSELNPKIHSPEKLLMTKVADLGDPPLNGNDGKVRVNGQVVDLSSVDLGFGHDDDSGPEIIKTSPAPQQRRESTGERLARLARKSRH